MPDVIKFGTYTFTFPQTFSDNFNNVVPSTDRIPGASGGFDNYGNETPPAEIGSVNLSFVLDATLGTKTIREMRDEVNALTHMGAQKLTWLAQDEIPDILRWCYAKVNNITMSKDFANHSQYRQRVQITFQVRRSPLARADFARYAG